MSFFCNDIFLFSILANTVSNGLIFSLFMMCSCTFAFLLVFLAILSLTIKGLATATLRSASFLFFKLGFLGSAFFLYTRFFLVNVTISVTTGFCFDTVPGLLTSCATKDDCSGTETISWHWFSCGFSCRGCLGSTAMESWRDSCSLYIPRMIPVFFQYFFIDHQVKQSISAYVLIHSNIPIITINMVVLALFIATQQMTKVCVFGLHATIEI